MDVSRFINTPVSDFSLSSLAFQLNFFTFTFYFFTSQQSCSVEREGWVYHEREIEVFKNPFGKTARRHQLEIGLEILAEFGDDLAHHAAVADEGPETHRIFRGAADFRNPAIAQFHTREFGRPLEEIIAHQRETGRNDTSAPNKILRHNRRRKRRSEVHHQDGSPVPIHRPCGIGKTVCTYGLGMRIVKTKIQRRGTEAQRCLPCKLPV